MSMLALSGWGQPHDALNSVVPEAWHFNYASCRSADEALSALSRAGEGLGMVIGWSLGAQLALRAIAKAMLKPEKLVLIAPPYQFVANTLLPLGMKPDLHSKFYENYKSNPPRALAKAWELVVKNDIQQERVRGYIARQDKAAVLAHDWQAWLEELARFSCHSLSMDVLPPTLIVHGDKDVVIGIEQSRYFAQQLPQARLVEFSGCGHAPHWHAPERLAALIREHAHV